MSRDTCDVAIIGGGPAGATSAMYLRQRGYDTVVLEKHRFPRFHVGESLLPDNLALFDELGIHEEIRKRGYQKKLGAEFLSRCGRHVRRFYFRERLISGESMAYQVLRSDFDQLLLDRAKELGADVRERCTVTDVTSREGGFDLRFGSEAGDGATSTSTRTLRAAVVVDASGQETFLSSRLGLKRFSDENRFAVFTHFRDVVRAEGEDSGNIQIIPFGDGHWIWVIPLRDGLTSIGAVVTKDVLRRNRGNVEGFFHSVVEETEALQQRMSLATQVEPIRSIADFSYDSSRYAGNRFLLVGDAATFLDPVFSSGVLMAMSSARDGAKAIDGAFQTGDFSARALSSYERVHRKRVRRVFRLIRAYYQPTYLQMFMNPSDALDLKKAVTTVLAGSGAGPMGLRLRLELFYLIGWLRSYGRATTWSLGECSHGCSAHSTA